MLELVGDGEGDLGARRVAQPNPGAEPDHAHGAVGVDQLTDQRQALVAVTLQERRDQMGVDPDGTLKPQVAALRRQALEELEQRLLVGSVGRAQAQRRAVPQDDVFPVGDRNHRVTVAEARADSIRRGPCRGCGELRICPGPPPRFAAPPIGGTMEPSNEEEA